MAIRGVLTHRKTRRLAQNLGVSQCFALGILESLWHVTAEHQPDGGIGRMSDQDIADEMFYDGDPSELVEALTESGWIIEIASCRLYVNDWHQHADNSIHSKLLWRGAYFANGSVPVMTRLSEKQRAKVAEIYQRGATLPHIAPRCALPETRYQIPDTGNQKPEGVAGGLDQPEKTPVPIRRAEDLLKPRPEDFPLTAEDIRDFREEWEATGARATDEQWMKAARSLLSRDLTRKQFRAEVLGGFRQQIAELKAENKSAAKFLGSIVTWTFDAKWKLYPPRADPVNAEPDRPWLKPKLEAWAIEGAKTEEIDEKHH